MITLKTLPQATAQEVFDQVVAHLRAQGKQAMKAGKCVYRNPEGLKCAAGCLIADDEYNAENMETCPWSVLVRDKQVPDTFSRLIRDLQYAHDECAPIGWEDEFRQISEKHGLVYSPVVN